MIERPLFKSSELVSEFDELVLSTYGDEAEFDHTASPDTSVSSSLVFLQDAELMPSSASVIVTDEETAVQVKDKTSSFIVCVPDVRLAQAKIKQYFDDYLVSDSEWTSIDDSAVIHKSVKFGTHCRVGPNAVIGKNCIIGDHSIIRANAVIEHGTSIGEHTIINPNTNIGYNCQIGNRVTIQAGAIIGSEGYGFAPDTDGRYHRIPHTGNVVIEDDAHVGANTCIDRGTYGSTTIARGVKIDNLVHIAHNVFVDEDTLLTAQTVIAGSSRIGKRVIASGQTGVLDHMTVPDDTVLVHRAGVAESLPHGGMWAGSPAKPFKEWVRTQRATRKIAKLEQSLKALKNELKRLEQK